MNPKGTSSQALDLLGNAREKIGLAGKLFDLSSEGIMVTDARGVILTVNRSFTDVTGYDLNEAAGKNASLLRSGRHDAAFYKTLWGTLAAEGLWEGEIWNRRKNGQVYPQWLSISALTDEDGRVSHYIGMFNDTSQSKAAEAKLAHQADHDALTGLPNRALFLDRLHQSLVQAGRSETHIALMFVNLDGFKLVNDTLGHEAGDLLLQEAATRLMTCVRDNDTVARIGGDEFTILLINPTEAMDTTIVAQRVIDELGKPFDLDGHEAFVSGSVGITIFPEDGKDGEALLKNADVAMNRAKSEGRAAYEFFTDDMNAEADERLTLKNGLVKALEREEFELYYQPKLDIVTGTIISAETLMRWKSPTLGWVPPVRFIPILEDAGLIREVGDWVLETACHEHARIRDAGFPGIRLAVNLSARQLHHPKITETVRRTLEKAGISPDGLELEITESMLMTDVEKTAAILTSFRDMGLHLAMDDFGTGYSSLSYLKLFPINTIKIDRSFISDITHDADDAEIVRAIINMGRALGRTIVAEGVETEEQLALLRDYQCNEIQGYLISRPVPADEFLDLLRKFEGNPYR